MRMLLVSPFPRWFLLTSKLLASTAGVDPAGLCLSGDRLALGHRSSRSGATSPCCPALALDGHDAGLARHAAVLGDPAARELRRRDELRDLPDVLRLVRAVSAVAGAAVEPGRLSTSAAESVHLCGRADPLRLVRRDRLDVARGGRRHDDRVHRGSDRRLRPGAWPDRPRAAADEGTASAPQGRRPLPSALAGIGKPGRHRRRRAIPTGRASRSRCRSCRWQRCGPVRRRTPARRPAAGPRVDDLVADRGAPIAGRTGAGRDPRIRRAGRRPAGDSLLELVAGLFSMLNEERSTVIAGLDRFGARRRNSPPSCATTTKAAGHAGRCRIRCGRSQPADPTRRLGGAGVSGSAPGAELRLRCAGQDRTGRLRWRAPSRTRCSEAGHSDAGGRGRGVRGSSGRSLAAQPSVPSGYQATWR